MPRPGRIRFLSRTAPFYDPAVRPLGFGRLWEEIAKWADGAAGTSCLDVCTGTGGVAVTMARRGTRVVVGNHRRQGRLHPKIRAGRFQMRDHHGGNPHLGAVPGRFGTTLIPGQA